MHKIHSLYNSILTTLSPRDIDSNMDFNVMICSGDKVLPLSNIIKQLETYKFNGLCVHGDCRNSLDRFNPENHTLSTKEINMRVRKEISKYIGCKNYKEKTKIYPFLTGYDADELIRLYESDGFWKGFGEIIYYNPKRIAYKKENELFYDKTPLSPIPELIQYSHKNKRHPIVQIHYWIGDDDAFNDLIEWAIKNPDSRIILCHGGFEKGDFMDDWMRKVKNLPDNIYIEISWTLLDELYNKSQYVSTFPNINFIYGSDVNPNNYISGNDVVFEINKMMHVKFKMLLDPAKIII